LPSKQDEELRPLPLHAKMLALASDDWQLLLIGSSNFTRAGLGIGSGSANLEANLAFLARTDEPNFRALDSVWPEVSDDEIDPDNPAILWDPALGRDSDAAGKPPLPAAFREALFDGGSAPPLLLLSLGEGLPLRWTIGTVDGKSLLCSDSWAGQPLHVSIPWTDHPPILLRVTWGEGHTADWPVNVVDLRTLPPPDALRNLTLEELLEVLTSTRPLHTAVVEVLGRRKRRDASDVELDPHKRVNTASFLLERTKRVALALERLRARLERPVGSSEALDWRLNGPIGPRALAELLCKDAPSPDEGRFFLAELALALKRVRVEEASRGGVEAIVIRDRIVTLIHELEARVAGMPGGRGSSMDRYITEAFAEAKKR
jgi:hypothetical protein